MVTPASPVHRLSAAGIARRIREGTLASTTVVDALLARISDRHDRTNAFVTVTEQRAREAARDADAAVEAGEELGRLHGVPVAIKDLEDVAGVRTTRGSLLFEDAVAETNATFVDRLLDAGAIVLGKTNTPEFGLGGTTDNRVAGPTTTPFDTDRVSGGSSGGAGAALADGLVPLAQGSDTGGSIRIPAACCGVVGLKPTFGRVPLSVGSNAFATHTPFQHLGPLARTVEDAALMLDVMAGPHPSDPFTLPEPGADFVAATSRSVSALDIAYSPDLGSYPVEPAVRSTLDDAVDAFEAAGATVDRIDGPLEQTQDEILDTYYTFATALWQSLFDSIEADHGLDPRGEDRDRLVESTRETILEADAVSTSDLSAANRRRTRLLEDLEACFAEYDLLVTATLGVTPFEMGEPPTRIDGEPIDPHRGWMLTQPFNFSGHPAASVPAGFVDGLPVGMQVVGPRFGDERVLAASAALERRRPWRDAYPE